MKKTIRLICVVLCCVMLFGLTACGKTTDFKESVKGTWILYHYYEHAENGVDVFLDDTNFWTITVTDKDFVLTTKDGQGTDITGGTITWTKADEAEVVLSDGTRCTMRISANSKKHNEDAEWDIYVVETNMYYVLENQKGE